MYHLQEINIAIIFLTAVFISIGVTSLSPTHFMYRIVPGIYIRTGYVVNVRREEIFGAFEKKTAMHIPIIWE